MNTHILKRMKFAAALLFALAASKLGAGVFGFEDTAAYGGTSTSVYLPYDYVNGGSSSGSVSTSSGRYALSGGQRTFYDPESWMAYGGGSGVFNSTDSTGTNLNYDANVASGRAASGSNYLMMYIGASNPAYWETSTASLSSYNGGYANAYASYLPGTNSSFDFTFNADMEDEGFNGNVADWLAACSIVLDNSAKAKFTSIDLSLSAWTYQMLDDLGKNDNTMGKQNLHTKADAIYVVRIYGVVDSAEGLLTDTYVDWVAGEHVDGVNDILMLDWTTVDLSALYGAEGLLYSDGLEGLAFQTISTFGNAFGLTVPSYVGIDNVAFAPIPEPSQIAALFGLVALFIGVRRRKNASK